MRFSIEMCRGNILDIINLAGDNNLFIDSIEQGPVNEDMINLKVEISDNSNVHDIDKFVNDIKSCNNLNSCDVI
jgi:ACT domain-containing protein